MAAFAYRARCLQTVHHRHDNIHQDRIKQRGLPLTGCQKGVECRLTVFGHRHRSPGVFQQVAGNLGVQRVILGQQQLHPVQAGQRLALGRLLRRAQIQFKGQLNDKGRALAQRAAYRDRAAHQVHKLFSDGQPQSGALQLTAQGLILLHKGLIDMALELLAHADAGILHRKAIDSVVLVLGDLVQRVIDRTAHPVVLDRVAGDIRYDALHMQRAADNMAMPVVEMHMAGQLHPYHLRVQRVPAAGQQLIQVKGLMGDRHTAALHTAYVQHIIDERFQLLPGGGQLFHRVADLFRILRVVVGDLSHAQNAVERRADVVAHPGEEG